MVNLSGEEAASMWRCFFFFQIQGLCKEVINLSIATSTTVFDGQLYEEGDEIPDLGSFVATSVSGNIRNYEGLYADRYKLPKYDNLSTGSSVFFSDNLQLGKYVASKKKWYLPISGEVI